jgi:hypothetical protein
MKLVYTTLYSQQKEQIIKKYSRFLEYFATVEEYILQDPFASSEETILYQGKHIHVRKRYLKTTFFSGLLPDQYMYLTVTYALTSDDTIVILFVNLHSYIN